MHFAKCDPYLVIEIAQAAQTTYVKQTAAHSCTDKGYFELAFASAADANKAASILLKVKNCFVPTIRTQYAKDTNLFIGFEDLPCTISREDLLNHLKDGLMCYGNIIKLKLNQDPLFFNSSSSRGYAIIEPLPNVNEDIALIPRMAHFTQDGFSSSSFKVIPERAPPICPRCQHIVHTENACPDNLLRLVQKSLTQTSSDYNAMETDKVKGLTSWIVFQKVVLLLIHQIPQLHTAGVILLLTKWLNLPPKNNVARHTS